jgi:hypothetical protein
MMSEKMKLYAELKKAFDEAIRSVGLETFKKTSLFMSNSRETP